VRTEKAKGGVVVPVFSFDDMCNLAPYNTFFCDKRKEGNRPHHELLFSSSKEGILLSNKKSPRLMMLREESALANPPRKHEQKEAEVATFGSHPPNDNDNRPPTQKKGCLFCVSRMLNKEFDKIIESKDCRTVPKSF
jgi:hypothetical protein